MLTEMRVAKVNIGQELISTIRKISEKKVEVTDQENVNEDVFDPKEAEKYGNFPTNSLSYAFKKNFKYFVEFDFTILDFEPYGFLCHLGSKR